MIKELVSVLRQAKPTQHNMHLLEAAALSKQQHLLDNEYDSLADATILSIETARTAANERQPAAAHLLERAIENAETWLKSKL
jgi:hypothetical protein